MNFRLLPPDSGKSPWLEHYEKWKDRKKGLSSLAVAQKSHYISEEREIWWWSKDMTEVSAISCITDTSGKRNHFQQEWHISGTSRPLPESHSPKCHLAQRPSGNYRTKTLSLPVPFSGNRTWRKQHLEILAEDFIQESKPCNPSRAQFKGFSPKGMHVI